MKADLYYLPVGSGKEAPQTQHALIQSLVACPLHAHTCSLGGQADWVGGRHGLEPLSLTWRSWVVGGWVGEALSPHPLPFSPSSLSGLTLPLCCDRNTLRALAFCLCLPFGVSLSLPLLSLPLRHFSDIWVLCTACWRDE